MTNAISTADIDLSRQVQSLPGNQAPWSVLLTNRMAERFILFLRMRMYNKTIIEFGFRMISWIIKTSSLYY